MWRSKFLRQLVIVAFLGVVILSVMEWRLHAGAETQVDQERARERLATAALVLDEESASLAVAYGDGGDLSHLDLTGPIDALDPDAVEAAGRVARAQVVVLRAEGERSDVVARSLERAEPPAAGTQTATGAAAAPLVAELPILRASDGVTLGFLRVHGSVAATSIHPTWLTLAAPVVAFFFLVGGIVVVYVYDRKTFQRIAAQVRDLADGATDVDFGDFPPSGTIYPMAQALMDLRRRYDEAAEKNNAALKSEMAARAELDGMLTQLDAEMGCLIGDLARGDFSQRILSQFEFAEIQSLAVSIQSMADTMENFLKETAHVLTAMAEGDLRVEMSGAYAGEFDAVARSANGSIHQVRALIGDVQDAVADGLAAVARISGSVEDLARRANDQVAAIQETASAMEQISTAVRTNTEAMVEADRMARDVALSTEAGGVAARGAIAAVERIRDSSKEISDIVRVIETIAFQTTILALNSAIEAARAGEAGRGFSVVATEVRSLAQRSSDAAKEIKKLITSSEQMVIEGVEMVQSAGSALHEIDAGIQNLSTRIAQVARSQIEQSTAIGQINANVANIESLAAESAALCESSGDETQALSVSMERVGAQMDRFRVDRPKASRAPAPASTARGPDVPERPVRTADELPKWEEPEDTRGWTVEDWARAAG